MQKPIYKLIGYTEEEYQDQVFSIMMMWADTYSQDSTSRMQILLANRQINTWFLAEFKKLVQQFKDELAVNELVYKTNTKDRRHQFLLTVDKIHDIYPKALITRQKAQPIETKKFSNN